MATTRKNFRYRTLYFWIIALLFVWTCIEAVLYVGLSFANQKRNLFYGSHRFTSSMIDRLLKKSFDAELGWDISVPERNNLGTRKKTDYPLQPCYKIKAFGDSFVYGAEVEEEQTFCSVIETMRPWYCLNYGVGAYGTDQALLKYRRNQIKSEYVILGILCENIGRVVSRYPGFYMRIPFPPKPRFVKRGLSFALLPNPISNPQQLYRLLDEDYIDSLKTDDYWPYYYEKVLNAPEKLRFPVLFTILGHASYFKNLAAVPIRSWLAPSYEVDTQKYKYYHLYQTDSEALSILKYLIDQFVNLASERNEKPLIIVFVDQYSLDLMRKYNKVPYAPLREYIKDRGYPFLDIGEVFVKEAYQTYYNSYNSHYSVAGNRRVAELVIEYIEHKYEKDNGFY